jgi:hypothetical protein
VEEDEEHDEAVTRLDDEDELMFPQLVDRFTQHAMEDVYTEELSRLDRFDDTEDEEKEENNDILMAADYNGDNMPIFSTVDGFTRLSICHCFVSLNGCGQRHKVVCNDGKWGGGGGGAGADQERSFFFPFSDGEREASPPTCHSSERKHVIVKAFDTTTTICEGLR